MNLINPLHATAQLRNCRRLGIWISFPIAMNNLVFVRLLSKWHVFERNNFIIYWRFACLGHCDQMYRIDLSTCYCLQHLFSTIKIGIICNCAYAIFSIVSSLRNLYLISILRSIILEKKCFKKVILVESCLGIRWPFSPKLGFAMDLGT